VIHNRKIVCDECGDEHPFGDENFNDVIGYLKSIGWKIVRVAGDWLHQCPGCAGDM
jgi:hypothetical protein